VSLAVDVGVVGVALGVVEVDVVEVEDVLVAVVLVSVALGVAVFPPPKRPETIEPTIPPPAP